MATDGARHSTDCDNFIPTMIRLMRGDVRPESAAVAKARQWASLEPLRGKTIYSHQFLNAQESAAYQSYPQDPQADFLLPVEHVVSKLNHS